MKRRQIEVVLVSKKSGKNPISTHKEDAWLPANHRIGRDVVIYGKRTKTGIFFVCKQSQGHCGVRLPAVLYLFPTFDRADKPVLKCKPVDGSYNLLSLIKITVTHLLPLKCWTSAEGRREHALM